MARKKKYKIRWGRVALLFVALALIGVAIYGICAGIAALIGWGKTLFTADEPQPTTTDAIVVSVTPAQLKESEAMTARITDFMAQPMRLDKNNIAISIYDATTQQEVYAYQDKQLFPPASCMKIATAIAAVKTLGMDHRYEEAMLMRGVMKRDTLVGTLLLRADDDPLVEDLSSLVAKVRQKGIHHVRGSVIVDMMRQDTLRAHPAAKVWDISYYKTPLLLKGKKRVQRDLLYSLRQQGITYSPDATVKPAGKYHYLAREGHKMTDVITPMMIHSSNIKAEALFYHLDFMNRHITGRQMAWQRPHAVEMFLSKTFRNDSTKVMNGFVMDDGSGLSPNNRLNASFLVDMLRYAYDDASLRRYFIDEALATPGDEVRRGSLLSRMAQPEYRGRIFCKTGTLTTIGASSLAGYLQGSDDHWYIFAIINRDSPVAESRIFQDKLCRMIMKKP